MNIKTLQVILGHTNYKTTMDTYTHVTDDTIYTEIKKFEKIKSNSPDENNCTKTVPIDSDLNDKLRVLAY